MKPIYTFGQNPRGSQTKLDYLMNVDFTTKLNLPSHEFMIEKGFCFNTNSKGTPVIANLHTKQTSGCLVVFLLKYIHKHKRIAI